MKPVNVYPLFDDLTVDADYYQQQEMRATRLFNKDAF